MVNAWVEIATLTIQSLTTKISVAIVELIMEKTIGEGSVQLALRIQGVIVEIISIHGITIVIADRCIHGITTDIADRCIHGITTDIADICIPGLTIEIRDICTPGLTMGNTGTGKIGKLFCYQSV
jgi:hypothetical protein